MYSPPPSVYRDGFFPEIVTALTNRHLGNAPPPPVNNSGQKKKNVEIYFDFVACVYIFTWTKRSNNFPAVVLYATPIVIDILLKFRGLLTKRSMFARATFALRRADVIVSNTRHFLLHKTIIKTTFLLGPLLLSENSFYSVFSINKTNENIEPMSRQKRCKRRPHVIREWIGQMQTSSVKK